jgi:ATP-dependent DNA helicase DinG
LGLDRSGTTQFIKLPPEFDYRRQAILYLPRRMPDPRSADFTAAAAREIISILEATKGRAFVLFTSYAALRAIQQIAEIELPYPVLVQGSAPRSTLLEQFRTTPNAVLLATSSFWQGVDVMGDALSCVIIDKLPFASPGDPITAARIEAIADRGGQPFGEYQVPLAILTLLQGLGRLIRHRDDRGVLRGTRSTPPDNGVSDGGFWRRCPLPASHAKSPISNGFLPGHRGFGLSCKLFSDFLSIRS